MYLFLVYVWILLTSSVACPLGGLYVLGGIHTILNIVLVCVYVFPLQHGFSQLQSMVVNLASYPSGKVSKATILEKSRSSKTSRKSPSFFLSLSLSLSLYPMCSKAWWYCYASVHMRKRRHTVVYSCLCLCVCVPVCVSVCYWDSGSTFKCWNMHKYVTFSWI